MRELGSDMSCNAHCHRLRKSAVDTASVLPRTSSRARAIGGSRPAMNTQAKSATNGHELAGARDARTDTGASSSLGIAAAPPYSRSSIRVRDLDGTCAHPCMGEAARTNCWASRASIACAGALALVAIRTLWLNWEQARDVRLWRVRPPPSQFGATHAAPLTVSKQGFE